MGVAALAGQIASADAPIVARLREAGAIPLARTNLPDFAFRWDTVSGVAGRTRNPWDPTRTPGGSSGGEAAALATGMTPLGLGNDLGGSLRVPSQMCGTTALRPSRGRVADAAVTEPGASPIVLQMTNCQGPMARHVADLRLALGIISAPDARDPRWVPAPLQGPAADGPTRVAVVRDPLGAGIDPHVRAGIDPHVRAGIDRAADWLADAGYEVVDAEPPRIAEAVQAWIETIWADVGLLWREMEQVAGTDEAEFVKACLAQGVFKPVDQTAQLKAWISVHHLGAAWTQFLQDHPVVLSPVCCERPWLVDEDISRIGEIAMAMRMVVPVNILGLPSCAVPVGCDDGLPQGVQLIGARFREDLLLDAAEALEARAPVLTSEPRTRARKLAIPVRRSPASRRVGEELRRLSANRQVSRREAGDSHREDGGIRPARFLWRNALHPDPNPFGLLLRPDRRGETTFHFFGLGQGKRDTANVSVGGHGGIVRSPRLPAPASFGSVATADTSCRTNRGRRRPQGRIFAVIIAV